jgi:hypothetical protein
VSISEGEVKSGNQARSQACANPFHGVDGKEGDKRSKDLDGESGVALPRDPDWQRLKKERLNYWSPSDAVGQEKGISQGQITVGLVKISQDDDRCDSGNKPFDGNPPTEGPRGSLAIPLEMSLDLVHAGVLNPESRG